MYTLIQGAKLQKKWHKMGEKNKINILPDGIWNGEVGGVDIYRGNLGFPNCFHGLYSGLKLCRATRRKTEGQPCQIRKHQPIKSI